ncbi:pilus assembly protein TadB [Oryzomicrobium terrae]|uniref:Pilus assembly protein TadB n=1 Tax=Oryzomicrobium terrae TaxID=1735038 RepID=A0A5C1E3S4_9RHOO|nr:type II secretion system F family protein [Oryzomicrobium terrae]QEL63561.1 pilus assembly protein TadB [Oryzomicrobium terrae]
MDYLYYFFLLFLFLAVTLLLEGALTWWNTTRGTEAQRISKRVRLMSAGAHAGTGDDLSILKKRLLAEAPGLAKLLLQIPRVHQIDRLLEQSGLPWTVSRFLGYSLLWVAIGLAIGWALHLPMLLWLGVGVACGFVPLMHVLRRRDKRIQRIEEQLPDALDLIGRALRAGHAFPSALKMVGEEMPDPIAGEFRTTFDEVNYGFSMQVALTNLATRVPNMDLRYFVIAVLIQRETGGNLAELLGNISTIIRDRLKLLGKIRVLSAEGRLSAWILGLLPFVTAAIINFVNPDFLKVLWTDPTGLKLVGMAAVMIVFGIVWMRKIIHIHV